MMWVLVRHGIARDRTAPDCPPDPLRPLTPEGVEKTRQAMRGLACLLPNEVLLSSSPFLRARQSAAIARAVLAAHRGLDEKNIPIEILDALQPGGDPHQLTKRDMWRKHGARVLFGHSPDLEAFASMLLQVREVDGRSEDAAGGWLTLKKSGALCLRGTPGRTSMQLKWAMTPKQLRALGDDKVAVPP